MKIVLDTNVLVAGALNPRGTPANILNLILNEEVTLCYDDRIINEYRRVLKRDKFTLDPGAVDILVIHIEDRGERTDAKPLAVAINDPDDVMFYEVLKSSGADFLVTGNTKHFKQIKDKRIVTPAVFMAKYFEADELSPPS
ncbi:MAG: putative toxin-antitoxin system toxin component, PIN family [Spirochaetes bacterium]|nr:MAG: putative toxin-antitoxin system toxin component, PIN family [Spirochaetota bacterium]